MRHYFLNTPHLETDFFLIEETYLGNRYKFNSCSDVFSKNELDEGTKTLLETVVEQNQLSGHVLDMGCGYGAIGIVLKKHFPALTFTMLDINQTAVKLAKQNIVANNLDQNDFTVIGSNLLSAVANQTFDHVVTNPPIKVGKQILFEAMNQCFAHLKTNGTLTLVIRKDHGQASLQSHLTKLFGNCKVLTRNKGYYILQSQKVE